MYVWKYHILFLNFMLGRIMCQNICLWFKYHIRWLYSMLTYLFLMCNKTFLWCIYYINKHILTAFNSHFSSIIFVWPLHHGYSLIQRHRQTILCWMCRYSIFNVFHYLVFKAYLTLKEAYISLVLKCQCLVVRHGNKVIYQIKHWYMR